VLSYGTDCHPQELHPIELWAAHGRSTSRCGGQGQVEVVSTLERGAGDRSNSPGEEPGKGGGSQEKKSRDEGDWANLKF